ncbi:hypothetical protein MEG_01163 [Bartonella tamiae Th307]|uniref:Uncharacterized protein n=1 Tax=Bartonella tamiae Th239 TaxID=1094558 RepID=J1JZY6_9HYPH|nr:hypothetical protein ME5_00721 [Bartonella tamiae Th239]EJF93739.1 hypothetical protein MEG_01163 [Bartonella tamiae Th307]
MNKMPTEHERATETVKEVTPPLKGGKLEKKVKTEKDEKNA